MSQAPCLHIGDLVADQYRVDGVLGAGGMGEVYLARPVGGGEPLALKVIPGTWADNEAIRSRFRREALALDQLDHPNIIGIRDFGQLPDGLSFLAMEYAPGIDLEEWLLGPRALPYACAVSVVRQIADALDHAHRAGIVHRDIKPSNILLRHGDPEQVLVIDFGLVKLLSDEEVTQLTRGQVLGTPMYMSPEQCQGREVAEASDVYSLGALAYHVLSNTPPFPGDNLPQLLMAHLYTEAPPLRSQFEGGIFPESLDRIVNRCLSKAPEARPSAAEVRDVFAQHLAEMPAEWRQAVPPLEIRDTTFAGDSRCVTGWLWGQHVHDSELDFRGGGDLAQALRNQASTLVLELAGEVVGLGVQFGAISQALEEVRRLESAIEDIEMELALLEHDSPSGVFGAASARNTHLDRAAELRLLVRKAYAALYAELMDARRQVGGPGVSSLYDELDELLTEYLDRAGVQQGT